MQSQEHEGGYKPFVTTARLSKDGKEYERLSKCVVDFELTHENKGFEGMAYVKNSKGEIWAATEQHTAVPISSCRLALLAARWSSMLQASQISAMLLSNMFFLLQERSCWACVKAISVKVAAEGASLETVAS